MAEITLYEDHNLEGYSATFTHDFPHIGEFWNEASGRVTFETEK